MRSGMRGMTRSGRGTGAVSDRRCVRVLVALRCGMLLLRWLVSFCLTYHSCNLLVSV